MSAPNSPTPTTTVTFLFTDIEGSTEHWEKHREAMARALERHDACLRPAIEAHGGTVFKTIGDAFQAAFPDPIAALEAAAEAQRALAAEDWSACGDGFPALRVRMALHVGPASADARGDYRTPLLNRVARLESAGHGGQVLATLAVQQLVQDVLPARIRLRDLGVHRLKDLRYAEHIFQVVAEGVPDVTTALRTTIELAARDRIVVLDPNAPPGEEDGGLTGVRTVATLTPAETLAVLWSVVLGEDRTAVLTAEQVRAAAMHRAADLEEYRLGRIAEWSQPRYRLDGRFVALTLLVDQGEEAASGRWTAKQERYDDLGQLLAGVADPAVVVLGPPGSGKSTLLRHLELDVAIEVLRAAAGSPSPIKAGGGGRGPRRAAVWHGGATRGEGAGSRGEGAGDRVTFFIQLNRYKPPDPGQPLPSPERWLAQQWAARYPDLPAFEPLLAEGRMILLLDGLNEMPAASERVFREHVGLWKDWLVDLTQTRPGNRVVFSCRTLDYSAPLSTPALRVPQVQIEALSDAQVADFLRAYSPVRGEEIWAAIAGTPQLDALRAPFFLALLVDQVEATGDLAGDRAGLFTGFVRQALRREVERDNPLFALEALLSSRDLRRIAQWQWRDAYELPERGALVPRLAALAYGMQQAEADGEASQVRVDYDTALKLVDHPEDEAIVRAGLAISVLDEDPAADEVLYRHQLVQEYFAARVLAKVPNAELVRRAWRAAEIRPSVRELLETLPAGETLPALPQTGWEETTLLAVAMTANAEGYMREVMGANLALAGRCAHQPELRERLSAALVDELRWELAAHCRDPEADLRDRIACGLAVGELGDPRFERRVGRHGEYRMPPLVEIVEGVYPIGEDEAIWLAEEDRWDRAHMPRHQLLISPFEIGQFPVTNGEWRCFIEAAGYEDERWWDTKAGQAWRRGEGTAEGPKQGARRGLRALREKPQLLEEWHDSGQIDDEIYERWLMRLAMTPGEFEAHLAELYPGGRHVEPAFWRDERYNAAAQPVVGISWYEARAYTSWLSSQSGLGFRLPTEVEWEAAGRGIAGRAYSYGDAFEAQKGNTLEMGVRRPTPVGVVVEGDTPEGVSDLTGNVNEWTISLWGREDDEADYLYPYDAGDRREDMGAEAIVLRVVRGGAWGSPSATARCASRGRRGPSNRGNRVGFRVVVATR